MTKPLGVGILNTAIKGGIATESELNEAVNSMKTLNEAGLNAIKHGGGANALTDITGFGMGGHLIEMMDGADLSCDVDPKGMAIFESAINYAKMGLIPKGAYDNKRFFKDRYESSYNNFIDDIVFDPETSGGLLMSVPEKNVKNIIKYLDDTPYKGSVIGQVTKKREKRIYLK